MFVRSGLWRFSSGGPLFLSVLSFISCKNEIIAYIGSKMVICFLSFFFRQSFILSVAKNKMVVNKESKTFVYIDLDQIVWHPSFFIILFVKVLYFCFFNESILKPRTSQSSTVKEPPTTPIDAPQRKSHLLPLPGVV